MTADHTEALRVLREQRDKRVADLTAARRTLEAAQQGVQQAQTVVDITEGTLAELDASIAALVALQPQPPVEPEPEPVGDPEPEPEQ